MNPLIKWMLLSLLVAALAACGGEKSGNGNNTENGTPPANQNETDNSADNTDGTDEPPEDNDDNSTEDKDAADNANNSADTRNGTDNNGDQANNQPPRNANNSVTDNNAGEQNQETDDAEPVDPWADMAAKYDANLPQHISVIDLCRQKYYNTLKTYSGGLDDMTVKVSDMQPWVASPRQYAGAYMGPLDAEVSQVNFIERNGKALGTFIYQVEAMTESGLIEPRQGQASMVYVKRKGSLITWPRINDLTEQQGQFVTWTTNGKRHYGFVMFHQDNTPFTLLRKKG